jgi:hypothetical protein
VDVIYQDLLIFKFSVLFVRGAGRFGRRELSSYMISKRLLGYGSLSLYDFEGSFGGSYLFQFVRM